MSLKRGTQYSFSTTYSYYKLIVFLRQCRKEMTKMKKNNSFKHSFVNKIKHIYRKLWAEENCMLFLWELHFCLKSSQAYCLNITSFLIQNSGSTEIASILFCIWWDGNTKSLNSLIPKMLGKFSWPCNGINIVAAADWCWLVTFLLLKDMWLRNQLL